jgi:cellulose synthase/poly-beta-1,6-N-acetylglucosamine synthase-like glycosyltransferase
MTVPDLLLTLVAVALLAPLAVLTVECLAALLPTRRPTDGPRPTCAVLVPAHDEEAGLPATLASIWPQLEPGDRLLVIADNCTDGTAAVAGVAGTEVLERHDRDRRGKGYALAAGVDALRAGPPDVVVVVDADCRAAAGAIDRLIRTAAATGRPVQAVNFIDPPPAATSTSRLSAWAVRVKNMVRPRGLRRLGLPCLLTGSGMAFPWRLLRDAPLATGHIVEDMRLGIDLAVAGHPTAFEPTAEFSSALPAAGRAARSQRTRWEHGHLGMLFTQVPRLWVLAVRQRRLELAGLALELGVPPLSVLGLAWAAAVVACLTLAESWLPAGLLLGGGALATGAGLLAWAAFGRSLLPPTALLAAPAYAAGKLPMYLKFLVRPQQAWVRTPRDAAPPAVDDRPPPGEVAR